MTKDPVNLAVKANANDQRKWLKHLLSELPTRRQQSLLYTKGESWIGSMNSILIVSLLKSSINSDFDHKLNAYGHLKNIQFF